MADRQKGDRVQLKDLAGLAEKKVEELEISEAVVKKHCRTLVASESWVYLAGIARLILAEYECAPPAREDDKEKWDTYCKTKWALDKLFATVTRLAKGSDPFESKRKLNVDYGPPASKPVRSSNRRATSKR